MKAYLYVKNDWDHDVIDVFLGIYAADNKIIEEIHLKGFDDTEWREAEGFAKMISESINVEFVGDRTDT